MGNYEYKLKKTQNFKKTWLEKTCLNWKCITRTPLVSQHMFIGTFFLVFTQGTMFQKVCKHPIYF